MSRKLLKRGNYSRKYGISKRRKDVAWNKWIEVRLQKWFGPIVINSMDETTSESSRVAFFLASADSLFCASHKIIVFFIHFFAQKNRNCTGLTKLLLQKSFFFRRIGQVLPMFFYPNFLQRLTKRVYYINGCISLSLHLSTRRWVFHINWVVLTQESCKNKILFLCYLDLPTM